MRDRGFVMYWLVFFAVFLSLCAREGKRATSDKPVSRLLRRFYEFGSRNRKEVADVEKRGDGV